MIVDGRTLNGNHITADICIAGAGAAGISLAREFIGQGLSVLLLESGGFALDAKTQSLYQAENRSFIDFPIETTRLRYFGGTTNHWDGFTYPLSRFDLTPRHHPGASGWPIDYSELAAHYPRAGVLCQVGPTDYGDAEGWQKKAGFEPVNFNGEPLTPAVALLSPPTRFGSVYRAELEKSTNVKVILNSNVQELVLDAQGVNVEKAVIKCIGGSNYDVTSRVFIVAMGGLETARLLLLSRSQRPAGLGNSHGLVGRYYMDHIGLTAGEVSLPQSGPSFDFFVDARQVNDSSLYGILIPRPETLIGENIGNFRIQLFPRDSIAGIDSLEALLKFRQNPAALSNIGFHIGNILVDLDEVGNLAYKNILHTRKGFFERPASVTRAHSGATINISAEQVPNPESRVTLSDKMDFFGQPHLQLAWRIQDEDRRTLTRGLNIFASAISSAGYGRVRLPSAIGTPEMDSLIEISCHHMGTTRMSSDPKSGVVDPNCKVHDVGNLYIASSSVFPTSGWANPTLTIVALALRLADHLKQQYG